MLNCKDCAHFEACKNIYEVHGDGLSEESYVCDQFSNRSRFVELPCKVGGILYHPVPLRNVISEYKIKSFQIYPHYVWVNWDIVDGIATINFTGIYANEIGETVFLTREEAEQALKERESK